MVSGWSNQLNANTQAVTNPLTGAYSLPVHKNMLMPLYSVNVDSRTEYPWPAGSFPDTSYWDVSPGASNINFVFISAETLFVEPFLGNYSNPGPMWDIYQFGLLMFPNSIAQCISDRLNVECVSQNGLSGYGVVSNKPFRLDDREYRVYIDHTELGNNNSVYMLLSSNRNNWSHPYNSSSWLMLSFSKQSPGGWYLQQSKDFNITTLWYSPDTTGGHILWQFNADASILTLKINGAVKYSGPWNNNFSIGYLTLAEMNFYPNVPSPVYFDEFFMGPVGTTGVKEIGGEIPKLYSLEQNYPNPFNPTTVIKYQIPDASIVHLVVYDVLGREVATLVSQEQKPGNYQAALNASNLASGVYYYKLNAADARTGKTMLNSVKKALVVK
jgi:hypothetical protein